VTYRIAYEENGTSPPVLQLWYKLAICSLFIVFYRGACPGRLSFCQVRILVVGYWMMHSI
jgi:hypothetical protein